MPSARGTPGRVEGEGNGLRGCLPSLLERGLAATANPWLFNMEVPRLECFIEVQLDWYPRNHGHEADATAAS
jgi:hypothetical protein